MSALPQRQYRDPLDALIRAEEETCKGCRYRKIMSTTAMCTHPRTTEERAEVRCPLYEERPA